MATLVRTAAKRALGRGSRATRSRLLCERPCSAAWPRCGRGTPAPERPNRDLVCSWREMRCGARLSAGAHRLSTAHRRLVPFRVPQPDLTGLRWQATHATLPWRADLLTDGSVPGMLERRH